MTARTNLAPLGIVIPFDAANFDISISTTPASRPSTSDGVTGLYTINLATGAATPIGSIGTGTTSTAWPRCRWPTSSPRDRPGRSSTPTLLANPTVPVAGDGHLPHRSAAG